MELIYTDPIGKELGYILNANVDMEIGEDEKSLIKGIIQINSIPKLILELQQIMDIVDESKKGIVLKKMQA